MSKITDFGEKIGGARKDKAQKLVERFSLITKEALIAQPLNNLFKLPNLRELFQLGTITEEQARICHYLWNQIDKKPKKYVTYWVQTTHQILQEISNALSNADYTFGDSDSYITQGKRKLYLDELAAANWPAEEYNRGKYRLIHYSKDNSYLVVDNRIIKGTFQNILDAVQRVRELTAMSSQKKQVPAFQGRIFNASNEYLITPQGKPDIYIRRGIFDIDELLKILKEDTQILQEEYDRLRDIPEIRRDFNNPRIGINHRNGDIPPETFHQEFPFRGCEFGNWVNQTERAANLNECADALYDMAYIIGIQPAQLTHNRTLAIGFGSRGIGKAQAHYEFCKRVINLTKMNGAGCLAHEWWHSLDNYLMICQNQPLLSAISDYVNINSGILREAAQKIHIKIISSPFALRSKLRDAYKSKKYWSTVTEMSARAFEAYIFHRLASKGIYNDYLVNYISEDEYSRSDCYPYPTKEETDELTPLFDSFLRIVFQ